LTERLAIPSWNAPPRTLADWRARFEALGQPVIVERSPEETWLTIAPLGLRGFAVLEGGAMAALHIEIDADDPSPALALLDEAARDLGWEVHDEDEDENED